MRAPRVRSAPRGSCRALASQVASWALRQSLSGCCTMLRLRCVSEERQVQSVRTRALDGAFVAGISVPHDTARRIVPQHALDAARGRWAAVADDDDAGVLRVTHADTTA